MIARWATAGRRFLIGMTLGVALGAFLGAGAAFVVTRAIGRWSHRRLSLET